MKSTTYRIVGTVTMIFALAGCRGNAKKEKSPATQQSAKDEKKSNDATPFEDTFTVNKSDLASRGTSKYIILQPGRRQEYAAKDATLVITVLPQTRMVDGVETAVVEERESENGKLKEVSRNFFAIDKKTGDLYYFGEEVDDYKDGKIVSHEGAWESGKNNARFGLLIPSRPRPGQRFYAEVAPKVAMDRCEVKDVNATIATPLLGTFHNCLKIDETTPLEKGVSHKIYAPNIGLVQDDEFFLVKVEGGGQ